MSSLVLLPAQNSYICSHKPDENFSSSNSLFIGTDTKNLVCRTLISFDLSLLPPDIDIETAVLSMYEDYARNSTNIATITPFIVTSNWEEKEVKWDNQPSMNISITGTPVEVSTYGWYYWDIKNIVQVWIIDSFNNYGLFLKSSEDRVKDIKKFHSARSYYNRRYRPLLEIKYKFKNQICLGSRNIKSVLEIKKTTDTYTYSSWQNNSIFSMYTFIVQNTGRHPAQIFVQISPDRVAAVNETAVYNIAPGCTEAIVPQRYGFFTRLAVKSFFSGSGTELKIWFQAQV